MEREIVMGKNSMTSKEEFVRVLLQKAMEKDIDATPYVPIANPAEIEEISKQLKKEFVDLVLRYW